MSTICVVGSINYDLILPCARLPRPGETLAARGRQIAPGGKGANQAVAAARLGAAVAMVGAVGDDDFADTALSLLTDAGVNLSQVSRQHGATGLAVVCVDDVGENSIVIDAGANATMDASQVARAEATISGAAVVVLQGEIPRSGIEQAAALTRGRLVVNLAPVLEVNSAVLLAADPLVVNEHEAQLALKLLGGAADSDQAVVEALLAAGVRSVVLTRGAAGALVGDADGISDVPASKVEVVDTTGAGDAFTGALAAGLVKGETLVESARLAGRVAAYACTRRGAQPSYPRLGDTLPA